MLERLVDQGRAVHPHVQPATIVAQCRQAAVGQPPWLLHRAGRAPLGAHCGSGIDDHVGGHQSGVVPGHVRHVPRDPRDTTLVRRRRRRRVEAEVGGAVVEAPRRSVDGERHAPHLGLVDRVHDAAPIGGRCWGERRPSGIAVGQPTHRPGGHRLQPQVPVGGGVDDGLAGGRPAPAATAEPTTGPRWRVGGELTDGCAVERLPHQGRPPAGGERVDHDRAIGRQARLGEITPDDAPLCGELRARGRSINRWTLAVVHWHHPRIGDQAARRTERRSR